MWCASFEFTVIECSSGRDFLLNKLTSAKEVIAILYYKLPVFFPLLLKIFLYSSAPYAGGVLSLTGWAECGW